MSKRSLPQPFEIDKIRFNDCFGAPSMRHFSVLITGWVLSVGTHTISQVILAAGVHESEHFATIYEFLGKTKWEVDRVAFEVFRNAHHFGVKGYRNFPGVCQPYPSSECSICKRIVLSTPETILAYSERL